MTFFEKLFGRPAKASAEGVPEKSSPATPQSSAWTQERLTDLFGEGFSKLLDKPGEEPLDTAGRTQMLKRFVSEIRSGKWRITNVVNAQYLSAAIHMIVAKENLLQFMKPGSKVQGSSNDLERELRNSINAQETLNLAVQMAEETLQKLRSA